MENIFDDPAVYSIRIETAGQRMSGETYRAEAVGQFRVTKSVRQILLTGSVSQKMPGGA